MHTAVVWRGAPNEEHKARIQLELFNRKAPAPDGYLKEYFQSCRLYFSPDFRVLQDLPADTRMGWLVMQEFWNDPSWKAPNADGTMRPNSEARTGVHIEREGAKLHFGASGRDPVMEVPRPTNNSWSITNKDFAIPLGKWMTQEIYIKEGGSAGTANPGRFVLTVTVDGVKTVLVDKIGMTTSEKPGFSPDGQTAWNPFKIYMEGRVAGWFKAQNKHMDVYWDDLEIWANRRPNPAEVVAPEFEGKTPIPTHYIPLVLRVPLSKTGAWKASFGGAKVPVKVLSQRGQTWGEIRVNLKKRTTLRVGL